jgi:hypothetical protein
LFSAILVKLAEDMLGGFGMSTSDTAVLDRVLECSPEEKQNIFSALIRDMLLQGPIERPVPIFSKNGECLGVYWPAFISNAKSIPQLPASDRAELLRRHATRDDSEDLDRILSEDEMK